MTTQQAKQIPLPQLLARLGHHPAFIRQAGNDLWYYSPFRQESTPSFHVSVSRNIWNDFGDTGGNLLDFVMRYRSCDLRSALGFLHDLYRHVNFGTPLQFSVNRHVAQPAQLQILKVEELSNKALLDYLEKRCINQQLAKKYLKEVYFRHNPSGKSYFALGFRNGNGGYELRNAYFKGSVGNKCITMLGGKDSSTIDVFEGFLDFLSYLTYFNYLGAPHDVLVLNSLSHTPTALGLLQGRPYAHINTFLDNDNAGHSATKKFQITFPYRPKSKEQSTEDKVQRPGYGKNTNSANRPTVHFSTGNPQHDEPLVRPNQPVNQPTSQPVNQPTSQPINQSTNPISFSHLTVEEYLQITASNPRQLTMLQSTNQPYTTTPPRVQTQNHLYKPYKDFNSFLLNGIKRKF